MISFIWPWAFAILPLPFIFRLILPRAKQDDDAALQVPHLSDYAISDSSTISGNSSRWQLLLYTLAWVCLVTAAARPQWIGDTVEIPVSGRDLVLAIDISKSMDLPIRHGNSQVSRIVATKAVASAFIEKRIGDRIGLILFGDQAYVQVPLTFDRATVNILLKEAFTGLAGNATAIGDAIGLTVKRLEKEKDKFKDKNDKKSLTDDRILILLTDGVSNRGELTPLKAAQLARQKGLKIHTIGIGNRNSRELDEVTLKKIAGITGGRYFRAYNTADLKEIYDLLDQLEPVVKDVKHYRPTKALFYIPLTASLIISVLLTLMAYGPQLLSVRNSAHTRTADSPVSNRST